MSTKCTFIILCLAGVGLAGLLIFNTWFVPNVDEITENQEMLEELAPEMQLYQLAVGGLEFEYQSGDQGYTVVELPQANGEPMPLQTLRLVPAADYQDEQTREGGEGSPSWLLSVYKNNQNLPPEQWARTYPVASNIELALTQPAETVVGGANAVSYRADGLYAAQVYVIAHGGYIFVAQTAFMDEAARTFTEHEAWINSFAFLPTEMPVMSGKLDPRVVCESALAYMTFENVDAADAFIEACVAGKHPEVMERYKADLGLDGATI